MKSKRGEMEYNGERIKLNAPYKNDAHKKWKKNMNGC